MKVAYIVNGMNTGGIESFIMNVLRNDHSHDENIIITYKNENFDFDGELKELGIKVVKIGCKNPFDKFQKLKKVFKKLNIDVVHCNTHYDAAIVLLAAKLSGIKKRIAHSHCAGVKLTPKRRALLWIINGISTDKLACGMDAGRKYYNCDNFTIVENGINIEKFAFNEKSRKTIRKMLNIADSEIVIGHIGRFREEKNQTFLVKVFAEYHIRQSDSKLIMVGHGNSLNDVKRLAKKLKVSDNVIFIENQNDTSAIYSAFDIFVFPSKYEGAPIALIEAQANGLPIIASDSIDQDINITRTIQFMSIEEKPAEWAKAISGSNKKRKNNQNLLKTSKYNVDNTVATLKRIYATSTKRSKLQRIRKHS